MTRSVLERRSCGVLLHPTSLPGPHGSGDLGQAAHAFVDLLAEAGQGAWQMLPVNPVGPGHSPYSGLSAFAGNPLLISLEQLVSDGLLRRDELETLPETERVDHARAGRLRVSALRKAYARFGQHARWKSDAEALRSQARYWLPDYTLFCAARQRLGADWTRWPAALARHDADACDEARRGWEDEIGYYEFEQLVFDRQWRALREHAVARGLALIGDVPIFVAHDSVDVWAHKELFQLDAEGQPTHVSGVPPDYFSATGQRWGTPLYRWKVMAKDGYRFWVERLATSLERFSVVRLDHFIGFARYWQIPASAPTAEQGRWMKGPGADLFRALERRFGPRLPLIAEDLGSVNRKVEALRDQFRLPGMRVLQFAFGGDASAALHLPHSHPRRSVAYTGTHDSDTLLGWFHDAGGSHSVRTSEQCAAERRNVVAYLEGPGATELHAPLHLALIRALFASPARLAVVPLQDWLGQDGQARMNVPGRPDGNWAYRVAARRLDATLAKAMREHAEVYGRSEPREPPPEQRVDKTSDVRPAPPAAGPCSEAAPARRAPPAS
jgi:4-alpha-glucanotransferase